MRNDFKPFAVNPDSEVIPQYLWDEGSLRRQGHVVGLASQYLANKAERQGTLGAAAIGELINRAGQDAIDDGDEVQLANAFQVAVVFMARIMLFELLRPLAPDNEPVLVGYDPQTDKLFGYPMGRVVLQAERLLGGNPLMQVTDYPDGYLFGGGPTMQISDYEGRLSGGDPLTI